MLDVCSGGVHNATAVYDEARIRDRSRMIGYGIDARRQRFTNEAPYVYKPFLKSGEHFQWSTNAKEAIHDYNLLDLVFDSLSYLTDPSTHSTGLNRITN
ncbi:MAG: hypothetical protein Ct9H300mP14_00630 [Gammaproteobacteria bacterium]|nr:MAG: hypothetical protein Ct9H300mP14_00630 [Gammaproteobacteria bacterium]